MTNLTENKRRKPTARAIKNLILKIGDTPRGQINERLKKMDNKKMNTPTRLRMILVRHIEELNPKADNSKIDALESDIRTFVKSILQGANELGLVVNCENYIGDLD